MNGLAICTIVSKNYLPYARVLAESFLKHNDGEVFVLLVDRLDGYFKSEDEKFTLIEIEEFRDLIPEFDRFCFQYTILELNTAAKPYLLEYLFEKFGMKKLAYFDPDILITDKLTELTKILDKSSIVLTPHITAPIEDNYHPGETVFLQSGTYNLGFIALSNTETSLSLLKWWQSRLHDKCIVDIEKGLFVDQKWMDLTPGFYNDVFILREPGYNVAYWNFHCRHVMIEGDGCTVNGKPSYFFHFSGFNPENLKPISKHQNRFTLDMLENLKPVFELYRDLVLSNGWCKTKNWPYYFGSFDNGVKIPSFARRLYLEMGNKARKFGNPFSTMEKDSFFAWLNEPVKRSVPSITRLLYAIYQTRPDLQKAFPDVFGSSRESFLAWAMIIGKQDYSIDAKIFENSVLQGGVSIGLALKLQINRYMKGASSLAGKVLLPLFGRNKRVMDFLTNVNSRLNVAMSQKTHAEIFRHIRAVSSTPENMGVNVAGYITSESGVGEAARANIRALEEVGIPFVLNNLSSHSRQRDGSYKDFVENNPYGFNLIHVNADQVPSFIHHQGMDYFKGRYNIGFWYWELSVFPEFFHDSFKCLNEVWVASGFCQDAISKVSTIPVIKIPPVVVVDRVADVDRTYFGLKKDSFVFFFIFDFLSFFERKNPLALINAFRLAFSPHEDVVLVLKCSNSEKNPEARDMILKAAKGLNVKLIDKYLDRSELNALVSHSDSYVSLHRSEGFGLPIAEAMYLGKPVIATGYSGNMEFMNINNSFPVRYKLVEIDRDCGPYKQGNIWADADVEHAAELMRLVYDNRGLARKIAEKASSDIKKKLSPVVIGTEISRRLSNIINERPVYNGKFL